VNVLYYIVFQTECLALGLGSRESGRTSTVSLILTFSIMTVLVSAVARTVESGLILIGSIIIIT